MSTKVESTKNDELDPNELLSIKQIEIEFDKSHVYLQRCVSKFKTLVPDHIEYNEARTSKKYYFKRSTVQAWRDQVGTSKRVDGKRKFNFYMEESKRAKLEKILNENGFEGEFELRLANPGKKSK